MEYILFAKCLVQWLALKCSVNVAVATVINSAAAVVI